MGLPDGDVGGRGRAAGGWACPTATSGGLAADRAAAPTEPAGCPGPGVRYPSRPVRPGDPAPWGAGAVWRCEAAGRNGAGRAGPGTATEEWGAAPESGAAAAGRLPAGAPPCGRDGW